MAGSLDVQSIPNQVEAIYIAYFSRAADGNGQLYWVNQFNTDVNVDHLSVDQAAVMISNSFAVQPEAKAAFAFLNSPPVTLNPADPTQIAAASNLVITAYENMFNRTVTASDSGVTYWVGQILGGAVSVGSALYAIANGATGADATVLANKIAAATTFTNDTFAANNSGVDPATGQLTPSFATAAHSSVAPVVDATTLAASQAASAAFAASGTVPTLTLTPGTDSLSTSASHAVFSAPLVTLPPSEGGNIEGGSSTNLQTLTVDDTLTDTNPAGDGLLNVTLAGTTNVAGPVVPNVTMSGISTANMSVFNGLRGFQGNITGLTTVNDANSNGGVQLGVVGNGLHTALVNVSITGFTGGIGAPIFTGVIAAAAGKATNIINVSLSGTIGGPGGGAADQLFFGTDGPPGTKASPAISYGIWGITANSNAFLQLEQNGVGDAATLAVLGAGAVALGADGVGNWQKLTTIDASQSTGNVTITGHATDIAAGLGASNVAGTGAFLGTNPNGLFGSAAGLLDGNTSLTTYILSKGVNVLDVSSFTTDAEMGGLTTNPASNTLLTNEIIVSNAVATTLVTTDFANIKGFQELGVVGIDGTVNFANLPTTINDIVYQTAAFGAVTLNNVPTALTVDTEQNGLGTSLTVGAVGPAPGTADSLHVIIGNPNIFDPTGLAQVGALGDVTLNGEEIIDFTSQGPSVASGHFNEVGAVLVTPTVTAGVAVTVDGSSSIHIGDSFGAGAIASVNSAGALITNSLSITDTDTGVLVLHGSDVGFALTTPIVGGTADGSFGNPLTNSTNAVTIDAHASGGLIMEAGDANFTTAPTVAGSVGDHITGSMTMGNVLGGSIGNDTFTGTSSLSALDTVYTGGGADTITLAAGHIGADQIGLYSGFTTPGILPGGVEVGRFASIVDAHDIPQLGWWNQATGATAAQTATTNLGTAAGFGTSADMSTVANFVPGSATAPQDVVNISADEAFSGMLHDAFSGVAVALGNSTFSNPIAAGGSVTVPTGANASVLVLSGTYTGAAGLADLLAGAGGKITFGASLGIHDPGVSGAHVIVAYEDSGSNSVHIADLDIHSTAPIANTEGVPGVQTVAVSDLVQLTGVSVTSLHAANIHFVA